MAPSPETIAATDRLQHDHAAETAGPGAEIAREPGREAEPYPVADEVDAAETIAAMADRLDAAVIVVGSRGLGRVKSRLLGSTSRGAAAPHAAPGDRRQGTGVATALQRPAPAERSAAVHGGGADDRLVGQRERAAGTGRTPRVCGPPSPPWKEISSSNAQPSSSAGS